MNLSFILGCEEPKLYFNVMNKFYIKAFYG